MIAPRLQLTTGFATGTVREDLALMSAETTEQVDNNESANFRIALPTRNAITLRNTLRFRGSDGIIREYRVRRFVRDPLSRWAQIEAAPPLIDLATSGLIRSIQGGVEYTAFGGTLSVSQWIAAYVLTNLSEDGLSWIDTTLGTIASTQLVTLQFEQWTRAELLRALADVTGLEIVFAQPSPGALYRINLVAERGSSANPIRVSRSGALLSLSIDSDDEGLATIVQPLGATPEGGTEPANIGQHVFTVSSIASGWVVLTDASTTSLPILFDDMVNGYYLQFNVGTTFYRRAISDSRASDGAVYLADTSNLLVGASVSIVLDTNGTPLTRLSHPAAIAQFGKIAVPISVDGMRGEANRLPNSNFVAGSSQWSALAGGWLEQYPLSEVGNLTGLANGSKTPGAPATLAVDGFTPNSIIRRGTRIEVASVLLATTSTTKVIPSSGNVTLPLSGTLAANVAAGQNFDVWGLGLSANGAQTAGASSLAISAPGLANRPVTAGDKLRFTWGGYYVAPRQQSASALTFTNSTGSPVAWDVAISLAQPFYGTASGQQPYSAAFANGAPLKMVWNNTQAGGDGYHEVDAVFNGAHATDAFTANITITVPAYTTYSVDPYQYAQINATNELIETRSITNSTADWPDSKTVSFTWSSALTYPGVATRIEWLDSSDTFLAELAATGTYTSTSWSLIGSQLSVIVSGSTFFSQPEVLYCGAASSINSTGAGTIALQTANVTTINDNAAVKVVRCPGWLDQGNGSGVLCRSSGGWQTGEGVVFVPPSALRTVWAHFAGQLWSSVVPTIGMTVTVTLNLVDAGTGYTVATVSSDPLVVSNAAPIGFTLKVQAQLAATARLKLTVTINATGGSFPLGTSGHAMASYAMLTEGSDPNVPFTPQSHCNIGWQTGLRYLQVYAKEVRSIACSVADLADIVGAQIMPQRIVCGIRLNLIDIGDSLRAMSWTRDHMNPTRSTMILETLRRTAAKLLGTGTAATGSGSVSTVSSGSGTTPAPSSNGVTLLDDSGQSIAGVKNILVSGLGVALAANGAESARISIPSTVDPTGVDAVVSGGAWVTRDLVTQPSYQVTVEGGTGVIGGKLVSWAQSTVTTAAANGIVYVDSGGIVRTRTVTAPETLTTNKELLLYRTYVDIATYGPRIYAIAESRTFYRVVPRAPLDLANRVRESVISSGTWAGAVATNAVGDINWYFANLGLYPFVEELPTIVQDHLDVQIAKFYGGSGTANSAPTWNSLHGTTWNNYFRWPYDVADPRGTPVLKRADSHDAYAGSFLRLAVRYARIASGGLAWWDANVAAMQDCAYYNIIFPIRLVNSGAGYMCDTFQDVDVYPFNQTLDNIEAYRGVKDALDLMTSQGGSQATWASTYSGTPANLLSGIQSQFSTSANSNGEANWLSVAYDKVGATRLVNPLERFYPDITIGVPVTVYDVPLHSTSSINRDRTDAVFRWLNAKAPTWFMSRRYDLYPWGIVAASAAKVGFRDLAERWLSFVQGHHANDSPGYFLIHDIGWARYVERVLNGESLT